MPAAWTAEPPELARWAGLTGLRLFGLRDIPLEGRLSERATLWAALRDVATHQHPHAVVLRGPAGTGKSRLCRWLVEEVHALGVALPIRAAAGRPPAPDDLFGRLITDAAALPDAPQARKVRVERHPCVEEIERALDPRGGISAVGVHLQAARAALDAAALPRSDARWGEWLDGNMWLQCTSVSPAAGAVAARELVDWAEEYGDRGRSIVARVRLTLNRAYCGEPIEAVSELRALWHEAQSHEDPWVYLAAGDFFCAELRNRGQLDEAEQVALAQQVRGEAVGMRQLRANGSRHRAMLARMAGRLEDALQRCDEAEPVQVPNSWGLTEVLAVRADVHRERGEFEAAAAAYLRCSDILHSLGSFDANVTLLNLSLVRIAEGRLDEADAILQRCVVSLVQSEQRRMEAIARVVRLAPLAARGDRAEMRAELAAARPVLEDTGFVDPDVAGVLAHAARSAHRHGLAEESRDLAAWARAVGAFGRSEEADRLDADLSSPPLLP